MSQQLPLGYKRKPVPTLGDSPEIIKSFVADELQRIENTLALNGQETKTNQDGITEVKQTIIDINNTVGNNTAAITQEAVTRTGENSAFASLITTVQANVATNAASVVTETTARADAISAEATARQAVQANVDTVAASVVTEASAAATATAAVASNVTTLTATVGDNTSAISTEATARADADTASATLITSLTAAVATANGNIANNYNISVNADSALATSVSTVSAAVGVVATSVTTETTARVLADGILEAKYGVSLDANGYITGFSQNNNGSSGTFKITADKFLIVEGAVAGETGATVFDITNGLVTMEAAHIKNLTTGNIVGTVNPTSAFSGSASKNFGPTSAGFVELMTVDCPGNAAKAHVPSINMVFDAAFATDTAYVKLESATVTGGSAGSYTEVQTLRHKTAAGGNSWTTIPVVGSLSSSTTSTTRFRVSIQMYSDNGTGTTNQSRSGTAHWSGTTTGIV